MVEEDDSVCTRQGQPKATNCGGEQQQVHAGVTVEAVYNSLPMLWRRRS